MPDLRIKGPVKIAKRLWRLALAYLPTVRNEEVVGSNPISSTKTTKIAELSVLSSTVVPHVFSPLFNSLFDHQAGAIMVDPSRGPGISDPTRLSISWSERKWKDINFLGTARSRKSRAIRDFHEAQL